MKIKILSIILASLTATYVCAQDPGVPDTVKLIGDTLLIGQSVPVELVIVNDEEISCISVPLEIRTIDDGFAVFDSVEFINRMGDPTVVPWRFIAGSDVYGTSPDTLIIAGLLGPPGTSCLPEGNDAIAVIYFTGLSEGRMIADSSFALPANYFSLGFCDGGSIYSPAFVTNEWVVIEAPQPPVITIPNSIVRLTAGTLVELDIDAESPAGYEVELEMLEFTGYDEPISPTIYPILSGSLPIHFEWQTTVDDIGIWKAKFRACDTEEQCAETNVIIQLVEDESYLVTFATGATVGSDWSQRMALGNFDSDPYPELATSGHPYGYIPPLGLYEYDVDEQVFQRVWGGGQTIGVQMCVQAGYITDDGLLDIVVITIEPGLNFISLWEGDGDDGFAEISQSPHPYLYRSTVLAEMTGDQFIDLVSAATDWVGIFALGADDQFTEISSVSVPDSALTVNSADFNQDGHNDLAVGTKEGVQIFLNDGTGGLTEGEFYAQTYGTTDIQVTNQGSDFNNDGLFDLCVSTPSVGAAYSEITVYLGQSDGSFIPAPVRTVLGYVLGNCIADFNGDNKLDIAYTNGGENSVGILFGDGDGNFTNEIREYIDHEYLSQIAATDIDLDADMDLVVIGQQVGYMVDNTIYVMSNNLDPVGFTMSSFEATALNNVDMEITSSSGRILSSVINTIPGASLYERNIDGNEIMDAVALLPLLEAGEYQLSAKPKPDVPAGEAFSLEYTVNDEQYRLASDIPMTAGGIEFDIYPDGASPVVPTPGGLTEDNPITFQWGGEGQFDFQLASDIEFGNLLANVTVEGNSYVGPELTSGDDTATFYWRVQPTGLDGFETVYPVTVVFSPSVDVEDETEGVPHRFYLSQNHPNPFNPETRIEFSLPGACRVEIEVFNIMGQMIRNLVNADYPAGVHSATWNGKDSNGRETASGIYLYRIKAGDNVDSKKMVLLK